MYLPAPDILKLTINNAVYWSAQAWDEISPSSLDNAWNKFLQTAQISSPSATDSGADGAVAELLMKPPPLLPTQKLLGAQQKVVADVADFTLGYNKYDSNWIAPRIG